ncbi:MAG: EutN/CcmL family microcompartment protein [Elusimicrobiota bacterium]
MIVAEVVGNVWGQYKHPSLDKKRLLIVRPIDPVTEKPLGEPLMAVDGGVQAGPGSVVLVVDEGGSARQILKDEKAPVRTVICGVIDSVYMRGSHKRYA